MESGCFLLSNVFAYIPSPHLRIIPYTPPMPRLTESLQLRAVRLLNPESAHKATIRVLRSGLGPRARAITNPALVTTIADLTLPNPVGLAAGFDKNAEVPDAMLRAGFGFVECGTVTPRPQIGNAKPRLFRLTEDRAVINRMGFNNEGLEAFAARLLRRQDKPGIVGANLGANKDSADRVADYVLGLTRLWGLSDYFTVNISSPNTPGLRSLQDDKALSDLLSRVAHARAELAKDGKDYPIFLKVAPDLVDGEAARIVEQVLTHGLDAIIVSNTTLSRDGLRSKYKDEGGGMSGAPLFARSTDVLRDFARASGGRIPLIGVGGISSGEQAYAKIRAGASAVQLYSALVYQGPGLVRDINAYLTDQLKADGYTRLADAVGVDI